MATESRCPLVSVLVPTYDGASYLDAALRSIAEQTYECLEIVLCDDGSTDATPEIARDFAADDPRAQVHVNEFRLGPVANFERCLALSSGRYVKFLMQDDLLRADAIDRLLEPLLDADDVVLSTSRRRLVDEKGDPLPDRPEVTPPFDRDTVVAGHALGELALVENLNLIGEPSSVLFRRSALGESTPFDLGGGPYRYLADMALWVRLLSGARAAYLVDPLSSFRHHGGQDSRVRSNMVLSVLEWHRLHREARAYGFLASDAAWEKACRRWLRNAPFFFRFCSSAAEAADLLQAMVASNAEVLSVAEKRGLGSQIGATLRSTASCLHGAMLFPAAALGAERIHGIRSSLRHRRARWGQR